MWVKIASSMGEDHGGTLTSMLRDLEQCSFIRAYNSIGKSKKDTIYQLVDNFTLFYFRFMEQKFLYSKARPTPARPSLR
jgi:hypothetical protein